MDSRFDDASDEEADVVLVGLTAPFTGPVMDCLEERILRECVDGGPMGGRAARGLVTCGFWLVERGAL